MSDQVRVLLTVSGRDGRSSASIRDCGRLRRCQEKPWHLGQRITWMEIWSVGSKPHAGHSIIHIRGGFRAGVR